MHIHRNHACCTALFAAIFSLTLNSCGLLMNSMLNIDPPEKDVTCTVYSLYNGEYNFATASSHTHTLILYTVQPRSYGYYLKSGDSISASKNGTIAEAPSGDEDYGYRWKSGFTYCDIVMKKNFHAAATNLTQQGTTFSWQVAAPVQKNVTRFFISEDDDTVSEGTLSCKILSTGHDNHFNDSVSIRADLSSVRTTSVSNGKTYYLWASFGGKTQYNLGRFQKVN